MWTHSGQVLSSFWQGPERYGKNKAAEEPSELREYLTIPGGTVTSGINGNPPAALQLQQGQRVLIPAPCLGKGKVLGCLVSPGAPFEPPRSLTTSVLTVKLFITLETFACMEQMTWNTPLLLCVDTTIRICETLFKSSLYSSALCLCPHPKICVYLWIYGKPSNCHSFECGKNISFLNWHLRKFQRCDKWYPNKYLGEWVLHFVKQLHYMP